MTRFPPPRRSRRLLPVLAAISAISAALAGLPAQLLAIPAAAAAPAPGLFSIAAHDRLNQPPLPCDQMTTFGMENCLNAQRVATDRKIDATAVAILVAERPFESVPGARLTPAVATADLSAAQQRWFAFRRADCQAQSDPFVDGTIVGVIAAGCLLDDSTKRLAALRRQLTSTRCGESACKAAAGRRRL